jgi:hypothetical protein
MLDRKGNVVIIADMSFDPDPRVIGWLELQISKIDDPDSEAWVCSHGSYSYTDILNRIKEGDPKFKEFYDNLQEEYKRMISNKDL